MEDFLRFRFAAKLSHKSNDLGIPQPNPLNRIGVKIDLKNLAQDVEKYPDAYQYERAARFDVCPKAIWQALKKLKITYKKSDAAPQGERRRQAVLSREASGP